LKSPRFGERLLTNATTNLHRRLLRTRREWPSGRRTAEKGDEVAPIHSITASVDIIQLSSRDSLPARIRLL
jgi:hypothetical protein